MDFPKSVPSVGLVDGKFIDEDVVAGTPGSLIPAQWGNAVSEEILNVIESAGLTPDEDDNAQLLAAVNAKITAAIPAAPPDASITVKGLVELATDAETQAGTDAQRAVTPAALTARTASETRAGIIELATASETQSGVDAVRAVTPATLASRTATDTRAGIVELATDAETQAGVDAVRAVTPATLAGRTATDTRAGIVELATDAETQAGIDTAKAVTPAGLSARTATETRMGIVELSTNVEAREGTDNTRAVTPWGLQTKMSGVVSGQYPITPDSQAVFNHNLGIIPFMVEFSFVCLTAEGGWSAGDVVHRGNWYQNSSGTDISVGIFWYGETSTQVTFGVGSVVMLLPSKTNGFRFTATAANWRFTARVIG